MEEWGLEAIPHALAGFLTPLFIYVHPVLTVLAFLAFMIYELEEWIQIRDKAYRDIAQYSAGFYLSSVILLILYGVGAI